MQVKVQKSGKKYVIVFNKTAIEREFLFTHLVILPKEPEYLVATFRLSKLLDTNGRTIVSID